MKQFLVCWFKNDDLIYARDQSGKWRMKHVKYGWRYSFNQNWTGEEFDKCLKVNNFKEK